MKISLGTFACMGVEANLGSDLAAGVREALVDYANRLDSGSPPLAMPRFAVGAPAGQPGKALDLPLDESTWDALEREAIRQDATVSELATHSVLVYLAEVERLTPVSVA